MITAKGYLARIAKMRANIYVDGEVIGRDHPLVLHAMGSQREGFKNENI